MIRFSLLIAVAVFAMPALAPEIPFVDPEPHEVTDTIGQKE